MPRSDGGLGGEHASWDTERSMPRWDTPDLSPQAQQRIHRWLSGLRPSGSHSISLPGTPAPELVVPVVSSLPVASGSGQTSPRMRARDRFQDSLPCVSLRQGASVPSSVK